MKFGDLFVDAVLKHTNSSLYHVLELTAEEVRLVRGDRTDSPFQMNIVGFNANIWTNESKDNYEIW